MHIALINQWYPPEDFGGIAMHNVQFAEACVQLDHQVTVIAARHNHTVPEIAEYNGVKVIRVLMKRLNSYRSQRIPLIGKHLRSVDALRYSRRVCDVLIGVNQETPVDIAEFADVNAEGFFWKSHMSRQRVVRCHTPQFILGQDNKYEVPYATSLINWAEKRVIRKTAWFTTPSQNMAEVISKACNIPIDRFSPIPNALDVNLFSPGNVPHASGITILCVGRLERAKGIDQLIEAIPRVCESVPDARFVLVGSDRPRRDMGITHGEYIEHTLGALIEAGRLELRGKVSEEELIAAYHAADIAVVPSINYESFSYTVAQAMSCGLPVVATKVGGIPETLDYGRCGILVEPENVIQLVDGLITLCQDETMRKQMGEAGRQRCIMEFSAQIVAQRTLAYYEKALKAAKPL